MFLDQPEITNDVTDNDVLENETDLVTFTCEAIGEPSPTIIWYFNDVMIITTDKYSISAAGVSGRVESSLQVINPEISDVGTYTCHAENVVGSNNSSGTLTVNGKIHILHNYQFVIVTQYQSTKIVKYSNIDVSIRMFSYLFNRDI